MTKEVITMKRTILYLVLILVLSSSAKATTWAPDEHTCQICGHTNVYYAAASWGSYIYQWPSKFQYIFWPLIDDESVYCCPKCHFSSYFWDFDSIPENKIDALTKHLATVKLQQEYNTYQDIPITTRLEIAKDVYQILERNLEFWGQFHRVIAYHYDAENNDAMAKEARLTSLNLTRQMLADTTYKGQEKYIFILIAAMHNFTGQKDSALYYLDKASLLTYQNSNLEEKKVMGMDKYFTELIEQYKIFMKKEDEEE